VADDFFGDISDDESFDTGPAVRGEDDEVRSRRFSGIENGFERISALDSISHFRKRADRFVGELFEQHLGVIFGRAHDSSALQGLAFVQPEERGVGLSDRTHIEFVKGIVDDVQQIERRSAGPCHLDRELERLQRRAGEIHRAENSPEVQQRHRDAPFVVGAGSGRVIIHGSAARATLVRPPILFCSGIFPIGAGFAVC